MITPLLKKIFIKCSLRPQKKDFWRRKTFVFLVSFLTVQKRPIEWLVQTLLVRHFPRLARLSGVMTQSGFLPWLPARNSGFFYWKQQASCRDLQKRSWCLFSFISMTMTTLPRKELKKNPWIQGKKKFRNFNLRALKINGQILLCVFVKDEQSCQVKLNVCAAKNPLFCQSWWKACYFTLDIF